MMVIIDELPFSVDLSLTIFLAFSSSKGSMTLDVTLITSLLYD